VMNEQKVLEQIHDALASTEHPAAEGRTYFRGHPKSRTVSLGRHIRSGFQGYYCCRMEWTGRTRLPPFPCIERLCGSAVASRKTVLVGDVTKDPRYLTTFGSTRSEIVIPVIRADTGSVVALIDAESERLTAFTGEDQILLEKCAAAISEIGKK